MPSYPPAPSRRALYRHAKRTLYKALVRRWTGSRVGLDRHIRAFLRGKRHSYLLRLVRQHAFALAVATALLTGVTAHASPPIELSDIAMNANTGGFVMNGETEDDISGRSVSGAGDVNGDGLADLIVGAPNADPNGFGSGKSYVVFGKADGTAVELSSVAPGTDGFVINGEAVFDSSGYSVSGAGDVNGDGLADLIVGTNGGYPNGFGKSYVVFGKASGTTVELSNVAGGTGGFVINGEAAYDYSGFSVSGAGDVNGDGLDDLIVGAPSGYPSAGDKAGKTYVVFGKANSTAVELSALGTGGFVINGEAAGDYSGWSVSGAGDVNGDGLDDLIVGAPRASPNGANSGKSYVVFGKASGTAVELSDIAMDANAGGFAINGEAVYDTSGLSVSGAGDVNGDGLADLIVGAWAADPNGSASGRSYVVFGKADGTTVELSNVAAGTGGFVMNGEAAFDTSGFSVSGAGDVNGDGLADLIVGALHAGPSGYSYGKSYVVFGKADGTAVELSSVAAGTGGFAMNGEAAGDGSGVSVSGAGDVNGDGLDDLIVGARLADPNGSNSGKSYVVFSLEIPPTVPPTAPASATYKARSRAGDGAGGAPVVPSVLEDARTTIDFSDDDTADNGSGGASEEVVTLFRSNAGVENLAGIVADIVWEVNTDRVGWTSAELTFKFTNAEISALDENSLELYEASSLSGPWSLVSAQSIDPGRNTISGTVTSFSFFAIRGAPALPLNWKLSLGALLAAGLAALGVGPLRRRKRRGTLGT